MKRRVVDVGMIPSSLWDRGTRTLRLPPDLSRLYVSVLHRHGLSEPAASRERSSVVGGPGRRETELHFAQAFDGSVARVELAVLDPGKDVPVISDALITWLAGTSLVMVDAPCGAGATSLGILATIAELRAKSVLPREPLDVTLICADISDVALVYANEMYEGIRPALEQQGVFVKAFWIRWNVTDSLSNSDLVQRMVVAGQKRDRQLITIANFNAALEKERKRTDAKCQFEELFRHASRLGKSMAVWIEPQMNRAMHQLFPWLRKFLREMCRRFARERADSESEPIATAAAQFELPLDPSSKARVHLAVMAIELVRRDAS